MLLQSFHKLPFLLHFWLCFSASYQQRRALKHLVSKENHLAARFLLLRDAIKEAKKSINFIRKNSLRCFPSCNVLCAFFSSLRENFNSCFHHFLQYFGEKAEENVRKYRALMPDASDVEWWNGFRRRDKLESFRSYSFCFNILAHSLLLRFAIKNLQFNLTWRHLLT